MADERISVVLEADAKQLTAEFARARRSAEDFGAKTLPLVEQNLNSAWVQTTRLKQGMEASRGAQRQFGQGLLQASYFADDLQYGLKGVMNNIPQLVAGFGAGAGLAGALSLAVLAAGQLGPLLKELYTDTEIQKIKAVTAATEERYATEMAKLAELRGEEDRRVATFRLLREMSLYAQQELRVQDQRLIILGNQRREMELMRGLQDQLSQARGTQTPAGAAATRVDRLREDLELARREAEIANAEYDRIATAGGNIAGASAQLAQAKAEIEELQRHIASGESSVAGQREAVKLGVTGSGSALAAAESRLKKDKERLKVQEEYVKQLQEEMSVAAGLEKDVLATLSARIDGATRERLELEKQIPVYQEIARLAMERAKADAADGPPQDAHVKAWRTEEERLNAELAARRKQQAEARNREIDANILRGVPGAGGNVAGRTGEDVEMERKRQIAIERVTALRRREMSMKIRRTAGLEVGEGRGISRLEGPRGLGPETRRRFGERERGPDMTSATTAARYYVKRLENDEKLIKAFEAIGLI